MESTSLFKASSVAVLCHTMTTVQISRMASFHLKLDKEHSGPSLILFKCMYMCISTGVMELSPNDSI